MKIKENEQKQKYLKKYMNNPDFYKLLFRIIS